MVTKLRFLSKVFWDFEKWTKKMSKNENPKKLCSKNKKIGPTCEVPFFLTLFRKFGKTPTLCSIAQATRL